MLSRWRRYDCGLLRSARSGCLDAEPCGRALQVVGRLDQVSPDVLEFFQPAAQLVMDSPDPLGAMAAALATLSGITERPKPRSLLTQVCAVHCCAATH